MEVMSLQYQEPMFIHLASSTVACVDCPLGRSVGQVLPLERWHPLFEAAGF